MSGPIIAARSHEFHPEKLPEISGIARELVATVRANVTIDWTVRENVRARLRVIVKRILRYRTTGRRKEIENASQRKAG